MNNHVTVLEIDGNALLHNLAYFKKKIEPTTRILAVVKAFGYGSDAIEIAKSIEQHVSSFAVAYTMEGISLRNAGIKTSILVLHPQADNLESLVANDLEPSLYNRTILSSFLELTRKNKLKNYPIHLKFNTGLNRLGFSINDLPYLYEELERNQTIFVQSLFSHLAASEDKNEIEFTKNQIEKFNNIRTQFKLIFGFLPTCHLCNTSGIINYPEAHFDLVRLGIGVYGFANDVSETNNLKNVISLKTVITQIHEIESGESVGYNRSFSASNKMKTATVAIGHADGLSRRLGNGKVCVKINNQRAPIVGNVCMDMMMVDVTNINCKPGDDVIIFDNQQSVEFLAKQSDTISYELLTAISQRVRRVIIS
jgi:alanine racemase